MIYNWHFGLKTKPNYAKFLIFEKNAIFFAEFYGENILKIITSVSGHTLLPMNSINTPGRGAS
jgi:hypothetical protein